MSLLEIIRQSFPNPERPLPGNNPRELARRAAFRRLAGSAVRHARRGKIDFMTWWRKHAWPDPCVVGNIGAVMDAFRKVWTEAKREAHNGPLPDKEATGR